MYRPEKPAPTTTASNCSGTEAGLFTRRYLPRVSHATLEPAGALPLTLTQLHKCANAGRSKFLEGTSGRAGRRELASPAVLDPRCPPGAGVHRWNETTVLSSHGVHGDVTPLLVTRKRTEWYISSLSSPQASESGRALAADSSTVLVLVLVLVLLKVMV